LPLSAHSVTGHLSANEFGPLMPTQPMSSSAGDGRWRGRTGRGSCLVAVAALLVHASTSFGGSCSFSHATCTTDADCGLPGVCANVARGPVCYAKCVTDADCAPGISCFRDGDIDGICVGCGGDNRKCAAKETCEYNHCVQWGHPECVANSVPCTISNSCVTTTVATRISQWTVPAAALVVIAVAWWWRRVRS
jgi:hypothetical protein